MKENAVVFSSWMPPGVIHRGNIYLSFIRDYFPDCDIYVGVNPDSDLVWVDLIESIFPDANIALVDPEMAINSDASAFQSALKSLKDADHQYKNVYFMHSKGISYPTDSQWYISCRDYFMQFAEKRKEFDKLLESETVGGWAHVARKFDMSSSGYAKNIKAFIENVDTKDRYTETMWLLTHYAIKGEIVKWFLDNCDQSFFDKKLDDRYFFEASFPLIVDMYGRSRINEVFWE